MYLGGALSIDREFRVEGFSWWSDEELSTPDLNTMVDVYVNTRPEIMVTHDCPESIARLMMVKVNSKLEMASRTRQALQSMFEFHQPVVWLFGHWHESLDKVVDGTRFICLAELEHIDL